MYANFLNALTLYCISFAGIEPRFTQCNQKVLQCGSFSMPANTRILCEKKNYLLDDVGDNISNLNHLLGDLTGLYWIWKNTDDDFVGTNQYRRFYNDNDLSNLRILRTDCLYVSEFVDLREPIWQQYCYWHGDIGLKLLKNAAKFKTFAITDDMIDELWVKTKLSTCNSFFAHRILFNKVAELLLEIVMELYLGTRYVIENLQDNCHIGRNPNDKRLLAFLAERILNIIYYNHEYFLGKINIVPIRYTTI